MRMRALWFTVAVAGFVFRFASADSVVPYYDLNTGNQEYQVLKGIDHYVSIVQTSLGGVIVRPHPGNGWGASPYLNVREGGTQVAGHVDSVVASANGVHVVASGAVATNDSGGQNGTWQSIWDLSFDPLTKKVAGTGATSVNLLQSLTNYPSDLVVFEVTTNVLSQVKMLSGETADGGDLLGPISVQSNSWSYSYDPRAGSSFPSQTATSINYHMPGNFNRVDGPALTTFWIEPEFKPTIDFDVSALTANLSLGSGVYGDMSQTKNPYADDAAGLAIVHRAEFAGTHLDLNYNLFATATDFALPEGDYDKNGVVDSRDFSLWRKSYGAIDRRSPDGNQNGIVDAGDYVIWRKALAAKTSSPALPEPQSAIVCLALALVFARRHQRNDIRAHWPVSGLYEIQA